MPERFAEPGSISSNTLRPEDLFPRFLNCLEGLARINGNEGHLQLVRDIREKISRSRYYIDSEEAEWNILDALNEYAPPGHYFGTHPGDGSDFGFWPSEQAKIIYKAVLSHMRKCAEGSALYPNIQYKGKR